MLIAELWFVSALPWPLGRAVLVRTPGPAVGLAQIRAIGRGAVPILGAACAIPCRRRPVGIAPLTLTGSRPCPPIALRGTPVALLSTLIALICPFDQNLDAGIGGDGVHLPQNRVLVTLILIGGPLVSVGHLFTPVRLPVSTVGRLLTPVRLAVTSVGLPVTPVRGQVALTLTVTLVGGAIALVGRVIPPMPGTKTFIS